MENPLLMESGLEYEAPRFDLIQNGHYLPAFEQGIAEAMAEADAIAGNPEPPTFENTVEALEFSGMTLSRIEHIFYNVLEADTDDELQAVAEKVSGPLTELRMHILQNPVLFERVKTVYESEAFASMEPDARKLTEDMYRSFIRNGAGLSGEDKLAFAKYAEELSLLSIRFGKNTLDATNAFCLHLTKEDELEGLPDYVREMGACAARDRGMDGWIFTLDRPSSTPFLKFSARRDLRRRIYMANSVRAIGGKYDNTAIVRRMTAIRAAMSRLLGYRNYAEAALERRMAGTPAKVTEFLSGLMDTTLPFARKELEDLLVYAREHGFEGDVIEPWDLSYWIEKYRMDHFNVSEEQLKPYFSLENCIEAIFGLAGKLYGLKFNRRTDLPGYHPDVWVYEVSDCSDRHLALFYADFFPRPSKRGGAWMTEFRPQYIYKGAEYRPHISIVTNFSKPLPGKPSLITHDEFVTFLHEFGHALHGILAEGRYPSLTGTSVARDFVELPSQIMENWAFEPEFLESFAKHCETGEPVPTQAINDIVAARNFMAGYYQVRQLHFGVADMAWHTIEEPVAEDVVAFERDVLQAYETVPLIEGCAFSPSFSHIFAGDYAAGYYSYKWAEVLEADAFSLFREKGIFDRETAESFRKNILSRGGAEDPALLYRNFRGHEPDSQALMRKLGLLRR